MKSAQGLAALVLLCGTAEAAPVLTDIHYKWQGPALIFYADFNQSGHDLPIFAEWRDASDSAHRAQIDYVEQYARGMKIAITVASLEKSAVGQRIVTIGQPRASSPGIESGAAITGRIVLDDPANPAEEYPFSIPPDAGFGAPK